MKIGILTQPLHTNYGGLLQAYALQTTLKRLGHDPLILDRNYSQPSCLKRCLGPVKRCAIKYVMGKRDIEIFPFRPSLAQMDTISKETSKFVQKNINKTEKLYSTNELKRQAETHQFDAYVVGSDQVWRLTSSPCITNYFLDFVEGGASVKRIAYAASFGVDYWHFDEKTTRQCSRLAKQFDAISVREDSGVELCRKHLGVDAVHVLDPTMLLAPDDYRALLQVEDEPESPGDLMTYILDPSEEKTAVIQRIASALGVKPFTVMPLHRLNVATQNSIEDCVYPPVTRWLRGYVDAKFVVTDSFHGCVFALLFNIPFIVIGNERRGMTRFVSLLQQFNLRSRLVDLLNKSPEKIVSEPINYDFVNLKIASLKEYSLGILKNNLSA